MWLRTNSLPVLASHLRRHIGQRHIGRKATTRADEFDLVVVGGGIVGTASAREIILRHPNLKIALLEKENRLAFHQSGHNSGVIHAGIYYKPGSLKAKLCVDGLYLMYQYCDEKKIPYKKVGKLIVATDQSEVGRLDDLHQRAQQNQVPDLQMLEGSQIQEFEPFCRGVKALWSPHTGIVDYTMVTNQYAEDFKRAGGEVYLNFKVERFYNTTTDSEYPVTIQGNRHYQNIKTNYVLTCCGLYSDTVAELTGCPASPRVVPFRGEYLLLAKEKAHMVRGNIYPVPNPQLPFLGVHFTPRMDGSVWLGPNAVLALKREGYSWSDINPIELMAAISYPGFIKLAAKNMKFGLCEVAKSAFLPLQVKDLQKYIPEITEYDISRGPAGVRAQAMDEDGNLVDDFVFHRGTSDNAIAQRVLHCRNAPSPGATSSLAIAKMIADKLEEEFNIRSEESGLKRN